MDENDALEADTESKDELESRKAQEVIGLLLQKPEDNNETLQQVNFSVVEKAVPDSSNSSVRVSIATSALNICHVSLTEAGMLLESGDIIQQSLGNASSSMHLEDSTPTFVQCYEPIDESDNGDVVAKFIDGQPVQLEDGSTAFIHTSPREGLQPVQLEDGTMAYLSQSTAELFNGEASTLDLENIASSEMSDGDGKSLDIKESYQSSSSRGLGKAFRCPYENCHRLYTTLHHLKVHERSHTGDRPFKCTIGDCGKAFATGYGLKSHTRVHTGETPYKCADGTCQKAFKTSGDLQKHVRTHTGERPFKCPYNGCDRAFTTSNIRKVHIRTHTGERPYKCEEEGCGRAFASATNYKNHIRIHTGEKPYVCNVTGCNRRFTEYSSLYKHHVVHTHSKPYLCSLCSKTYRQISTLAMHKRTAHGVIEQNETDLILAAEEKPEESGISEPETAELKIKIESPKSLKIQNDCVVKKKDHKSVLKTNSGPSGSSSANSSMSKSLPTIVTLQSDHSNQVLQEQPLYALQVTEDGSTTMQQIVLVTDPAQIAAFQQLAQQGQLNAVIASTDESSASENT